jgi:DNA-binding transcriptional LysR family regulator
MELVELTSDEQVQRLRDNVLDVGFLRLPLVSGANFEVVRLGQERMMVALQHSHSLAGQKVIAPSALRSEKFIMAGGQANAGLAAVVRRICEKSGFIPDVTQTVSQITTAITLVEAGLGVAFVPESFAAMQVGTITYRHLRGVEDVSEIALVAMARERSPIASNFMKCAAAAAAASRTRQR